MADLTEWIREAGKTDAQYMKLVQDVGEGVVRRYWVEDELLHAKGGKLFVPRGGKLRLELMWDMTSQTGSERQDFYSRCPLRTSHGNPYPWTLLLVSRR
ncbi:hypothetical protein DsansV1_C22g0171981 [Dioscorea sansibarensis]